MRLWAGWLSGVIVRTPQYQEGSFPNSQDEIGMLKGVMDTWKQWSLSMALEYYDSNDRYTLHSVDQANPGLVDFAVISASISRKF